MDFTCLPKLILFWVILLVLCLEILVTFVCVFAEKVVSSLSWLDTCIFTLVFFISFRGIDSLLASVWIHPHDSPAEKDIVDWLFSNNIWEKLIFACMLSHFSHVWLFVTLWTVAHEASPSIGNQYNIVKLKKKKKNTGAFCQGIFLSQGLNPCLLRLLHYRQILYHWALNNLSLSPL